MKELDDLYPSVFKMIRAKAKTIQPIRFDKKVHINIVRRLKSILEKLFKSCRNQSNVSSSLFPVITPRLRDKIFYKDKKGRNHADILEMIRNDRAIIPMSKIKRITLFYVNYYIGNAPIDSDVYPIIQAFIENQVYDYVHLLLKHVKKKKRKMVKSVHVLEI